jgi:hypothetical protein
MKHAMRVVSAAQMCQEEVMMATPDETVFSHVVDVVVEPVAEDHHKHAVVTVILGTQDGKRIHYSLTVKAALTLHLMLTRRLKFLVSDTDLEPGK